MPGYIIRPPRGARTKRGNGSANRNIYRFDPIIIFGSDPAILHRNMITFGCLVPLPGWGEVRVTLRTGEGLGHGRGHGVQVEDAVDALLQPCQVDELCVGRVGDKMHFWWRRFRWGDLKVE